MAGRRDDGTRDRLPVSDAHPARRGTLHTVGLLAGLLLAVGATAAVLVTDDARHLRVALLAACWAFMVAAFLAGGRRADRLAAEGREAELRHAYEVELEREVAARARYELQLEQRLRREAGEGMRRELVQMRRDLAGLGELRADLGRIRGEFSDQLSGGLLIESMVMRAQAVRLPAEASDDDSRTLDGAVPLPGPAGGTWEQGTTVERWPDSRDDVPLARSVPGSEAVPGVRRPPPPPIGSTRRPVPVQDELARRPSPTPSSRHRVGLDAAPVAGVAAAPRHHRRAAEPDGDVRAAAVPPAPVLAAPVPATPEPVATDPAPDGAWWNRPAWSSSPGRPGAAPADPVAPQPARPPAEASSGHARLEQILAESGLSPAPGRRRRRHRDEADARPADDVLARVLGTAPPA